MTTTTRPTHGEPRSPLQKKIDADVLERVRRGIAFLEREHGPHWVDKIDLDTLDLAQGSCCVLGQVYHERAYEYGGDGYSWALSHVLEPSEDSVRQAVRLGFSLGLDEIDWDELQDAWEAVLEPMVEARG